MRVHRDNDKGRALCSRCEGLVTTTFRRRDVPFSDGKGLARHILVGVCDVCDQVVAIPAQSTPPIREARQRQLKAIEATLPALYVDVLDYAAHTIDHTTSTDFRRVLLTYFLHRAARDEKAAGKLLTSHEQALVLFPEVRGSARRRLSMKVPVRVDDDLQALKRSTALSTTELLKSLVYDIQTDVLAAPKPALLRELRALAVVTA